MILEDWKWEDVQWVCVCVFCDLFACKLFGYVIWGMGFQPTGNQDLHCDGKDTTAVWHRSFSSCWAAFEGCFCKCVAVVTSASWWSRQWSRTLLVYLPGLGGPPPTDLFHNFDNVKKCEGYLGRNLMPITLNRRNWMSITSVIDLKPFFINPQGSPFDSSDRSPTTSAGKRHRERGRPQKAKGS